MSVYCHVHCVWNLNRERFVLTCGVLEQPDTKLTWEMKPDEFNASIQDFKRQLADVLPVQQEFQFRVRGKPALVYNQSYPDVPREILGYLTAVYDSWKA